MTDAHVERAVSLVLAVRGVHHRLAGGSGQPARTEGDAIWAHPAIAAAIRAAAPHLGGSLEHMYRAIAAAQAVPDPREFADLRSAELEQLRLLRAVITAIMDGPCDEICHDPLCNVSESHLCHGLVCAEIRELDVLRLALQVFRAGARPGDLANERQPA